MVKDVLPFPAQVTCSPLLLPHVDQLMAAGRPGRIHVLYRKLLLVLDLFKKHTTLPRVQSLGRVLPSNADGKVERDMIHIEVADNRVHRYFHSNRSSSPFYLSVCVCIYLQSHRILIIDILSY